MKSKLTIYLCLLVVLVHTLYYVKIKYYNIKDVSDIKIIEGTIKNVSIQDSQVKLYIDNYLVFYNVNDVSVLNELKIGNKIKVFGETQIPQEEQNFYLFNYRKYLLSKNVDYIVYANKIDVLSYTNNYIYKLKNCIVDRIDKYKNNQYLYAFILGDSSKIENMVLESYRNNGIMHLFAISGMHVSLISGLIIFFLQKVLKLNNLSYILLYLFFVFFVFLTNFSVSVIRASLLSILCMLNKRFKLEIKVHYILIYIFCISMIYNPYNIYNIGFIFSYTISYFLIKYSSIINSFRNYFSKLFVASSIAFMCSMPIMINNYFNINLLTIIFNMLFVPFISFIIFPLSLLTFLFPFLDTIFNFFIFILENISLFLANIKVFNITLCRVSYITIVIYYIIIIFVINKIKLKEYKYIVIILIIIFLHHNIRYLDIYPKISFINVGQGDSILLTLPHNKNILIDCAGKVSYNNSYGNQDIAKNIIIPYLKAQGINKLDYIINTHGDYDHIGSLDKILDSIKVNTVIFNSGNDNDTEKYIMNKLKQKNINYYKLSKGNIKINNTILYFINDKDISNENEDSLVIYTKINGIKILLMGDAGFDTENYLLNEYNLSNLDILKVGHHGSKYSTSDEFINIVNPKYSIISVGENNKYGHPDKNVINKLIRSKTYLTSINGSIEITLKKKILVNSVR